MTTKRINRAESAHKYDYGLIIAVVALLIIGLMMVYSSTVISGLGEKLEVETNHFFMRQVLFMVFGVVVLVVLSRIEYHTWRRFSIPVMIATLVMLGLLAFISELGIGPEERHGGTRWFFGGSVQPSEAAKLAVIIYIADWLSSKGKRIRQVTYGLIPFAILLGFVAGLIMLQPDFSTAVLIVVTAFVMFFIAGGDLWQIVASTILGSIPLILLVVNSSYRMARVTSFLKPLEDAAPGNYQMMQGLVALAHGGAVGMGLGSGRQKFGYIPLTAMHTDNIFAVLGEEMGLIGCLLVLALFAFLAYRGFRVAMNSIDVFGAVLATGITTLLVFQALINIAVVTATIPTTGIPLPFISYGGSSLVVSLAGVGLLLSVSRGTQPDGVVADLQEGGDQKSPGDVTKREDNDIRRRDRRSRISRPDRRRLAER